MNARLISMMALVGVVGCAEQRKLEAQLLLGADGDNSAPPVIGPAGAGSGNPATTTPLPPSTVTDGAVSVTPVTAGNGSATGGLAFFQSDTEFAQYMALSPIATGYGGGGGWPVGPTTGSGPSAPTAPSTPTGPSYSPTSVPTSGGAATYSGTTVQEAAVDEADHVKNDGKHIYLVKGRTLRVIEAYPLGNLAQVGGAALPGEAGQLFLHDGHAIVCSAADCGSAVSVFDVRDPANPVLRYARYFDGRLQASRMIGWRLHLVLANGVWYGAPAPQNETDAQRVARFLPNVRRQPWEAGVELLTSAAVLHPKGYDLSGCALLTVASLDVRDATAPIRAVGVMEQAGIDYVSPKALYLVRTGWWSGSDSGIHKFSLTDQGPVYEGSGQVNGTIMNAYSLGEHNGYLRIATRTFTLIQATATWWQNRPSSAVYVLGVQSGALAVVGSKTDIKVGETLFAARFCEDIGYLITAIRAWDPLITLDLSDPTKPTIQGEFDYEGVADFLLPIGNGRLLSVGRRGQAGMLSGVQVCLFDVSDLTKPIRVAWFDVSTTGTSPAGWDPKAFQWYAAQGWLGVPVQEWVQTSYPGGGYGYTMVTRLEVLEVRNDTITRKGGLVMPQASTPTYGFGAAGWARSAFFDDVVIGMTDIGCVGTSVPSFGTTIQAITLP